MKRAACADIQGSAGRLGERCRDPTSTSAAGRQRETPPPPRFILRPGMRILYSLAASSVCLAAAGPVSRCPAAGSLASCLTPQLAHLSDVPNAELPPPRRAVGSISLQLWALVIGAVRSARQSGWCSRLCYRAPSSRPTRSTGSARSRTTSGTRTGTILSDTMTSVPPSTACARTCEVPARTAPPAATCSIDTTDSWSCWI